MAERMVGDTVGMGGRQADKVTTDVTGFTWKMAIVLLLVVVLGGLLISGFWIFVGSQGTRVTTENTAARPAEP